VPSGAVGLLGWCARRKWGAGGSDLCARLVRRWRGGRCAVECVQVLVQPPTTHRVSDCPQICPNEGRIGGGVTRASCVTCVSACAYRVL
jgi:hypothetical protein